MERGVSGRTRALVVLGLSVLVIGIAAGVHVTAKQPQSRGFEFEEVSGDRGLNYTYMGSGISNTNPGVYVSDYDDDGWSDVLLIGGKRPALFENQGGTFERSGDLPRLPNVTRVHSALFFDYDNDGREDLLLLTDPGIPHGDYTPPSASGTNSSSSNVSHPVLLHNTGERFVVANRLENVPLRKWPIGATTADYDKDGCADVFIYQDGDWADRTPVGFHNASSVGNITNDNGEPNYLLRGNCEGDFERVGRQAGITGERWSLAASFTDFTGDGWPDIHVANDYNEDFLYINRGNGTFREVRMGDVTDRNGMSSEVADVNSDGRLDVFVTNIANPMIKKGDVSKDTKTLFVRKGMANNPRHKGNTLMVNRGNGTFVDVAPEYGVRRAPKLWGWAAVMSDLDNDGDSDLIHTNNEISSITSNGGRAVIMRSDTPPAIWERTGPKNFSTLRPTTVGLKKMNGRGIVQLDFDRDGDLDIIVADDGDSVKLYENVQRGGHWLQIRVLDGLGGLATNAKVYTTVGNETRLRVQNAKVDFLSQEPRVLHVGLGQRSSVGSLRVVWPDGTTHVFHDVPADRRVLVAKNGTLLHAPKEVT